MDNTFNMWLGIIIISLVGTLAHFLYDLTRQNHIIGLFAAVNESTWEHIKIALTPTFLWCLYDGYFYGIYPNYFLAKLLSLFSIVIIIPLIFYSYRAIAKKSILPIDISIFYIAIIVSQVIFYSVITLPSISYVFQYLSCLGVFIFFGCYMTLTLDPLKNFIFKDPITGKYGFRAHKDFFKSLKEKHFKHKKSKK